MSLGLRMLGADGSIVKWRPPKNYPLTSCLTGLDLTKLVNFYLIQHQQSS